MGNMTVLQDESIQQMMGQDSVFSDKNYGAFAPIPRNADVQTEQDPLYALTDQLVPVIVGEMDINSALRQAEEAVNQGIETAKRMGN